MTHNLLSSVAVARVASALLLLFVAGCITTDTPSPSKSAAAPAAAKADGAFDDDAHPLTPIESKVTAAGKDPAKLAAVEHDLLAILQDPASSPALMQEAAQNLGHVIHASNSALEEVYSPSDTALKVLGPMLGDPTKVDYARLALDRVPGEAVDRLYFSALGQATGRTQLALIESAGTRGMRVAIARLGPWLNDANPALATATAQALGRMGPNALLVLESAKNPLAPAVLNARLAAVAGMDKAAFSKSLTPIIGRRQPVFPPDDIYHNAAAPLAQRSAALRQLIGADSTVAADEIYSALAGKEPAFQIVAIAAVAVPEVSVPASELANRLGSYAPDVQVPLIAALATRGHAAAIPGLLKALDSTDAGVRAAAIDALGRLPGSTEVAKRLATIAAGKGDDAKAAFASLARLNGPGIDSLVRTGAEAASAQQAVFIQQLAARNQTEAMPFLLDLRESPSEAVRLEALDALRAIATAAEQPALIAWALGTSSQAEQNRAVRALITIILRDGNLATRADTVNAAIKKGLASERLILLPVLSRVAGPAALATARSLAQDANEDVANAAAGELTRWPDAVALPALVDLAVATRSPGVRATAAQGAARFLAQNGNTTPAQRSAQVRALLDVPVEPGTRQSLINVLSLCADDAALAAAKRFIADSDPATAAAARDAVDAIASTLAGRPVVTASITSADPALMADGNATSFWQVPENEAGTWIRADLHSPRPVRKIFLNHRTRNWGYPGKFEVQVSDNPDQPGAAIIEAEGESAETVVTLPAGTRGRYVWLRLTGRRDAPLAISELRVE